MFAHLLRASDARYAIGAVVSWPIYGALYILSLIYESPALVSITVAKRAHRAAAVDQE
jgi:hypothetical protein